MEPNNNQTEINVEDKIAHLFELIDRELEKPEEEVDIDKVEAYLAEIDKLDGGAYKKSEEELDKMLQAIYSKKEPRKKEPIYLFHLNKVGKRVAIITVVLSLFFAFSACAFAMNFPSVQFFLTVQEKFSELFFRQKDIENAPDTIETVYTLGYVPEGYELMERKVEEPYVKSVWVNANNQELIFEQTPLKTSTILDNENTDGQIVYINNIKTIIITKFNSTQILWNDNDYVYSVIISDCYAQNEYEKIIASLEEYIK